MKHVSMCAKTKFISKLKIQISWLFNVMNYRCYKLVSKCTIFKYVFGGAVSKSFYYFRRLKSKSAEDIQRYIEEEIYSIIMETPYNLIAHTYEVVSQLKVLFKVILRRNIPMHII